MEELSQREKLANNIELEALIKTLSDRPEVAHLIVTLHEDFERMRTTHEVVRHMIDGVLHE